MKCLISLEDNNVHMMSLFQVHTETGFREATAGLFVITLSMTPAKAQFFIVQIFISWAFEDC